MLPFRISTAAREWFKDLRHVDKGFKIDFDPFYFCFIAGVATGRKITLPTDETRELVERFPQDYQPYGTLIVALFLNAELRNLGISLSDRQTVHLVVGKLVDPASPHHLSSRGVQELNKYSYGGYEVLQDWFVDRPRTLPTFLQAFKANLDRVLEANPWPRLVPMEEEIPMTDGTTAS